MMFLAGAEDLIVLFLGLEVMSVGVYVLAGYNRADPFYQHFLRQTPIIGQWDDHEVINDFGAPWTYWNSATVARAWYPNLVAQGLETFFAYTPMERPGMRSKRRTKWPS